MPQCKNIILISLFLALAAYGQQLQRIAILGTEDDGEPPIEILEQTHLTDKLREIASNNLPSSRYGVMTQQSIVDRLGSQEQAAKICEEAICLVDLGRKVNADYIAQARIGRFGGNLTIKVELYNVGSGNLIASFTGDSKDAKGLLSVLEIKAPALFEKMPNVSSGTASPAVQGGISGLQSTDGYEFDYQKRYLANITTEPEGAILSFDGSPDSRCIKTPCKVELAGGRVRIVAVLEQYEKADTTVLIKQNNQNINIMLKANFGVLEIKPAYLDDIGSGENWNLTINDKVVSSLKNNLSPGKYSVKLSHRCYEDLSFDAGINKGKREVFDMASYVKLKKGGLVLNAERDDEPASVSVFVNGKQVGETPFSGTVPVCSHVEIGENRETVDVNLEYREKVRYTHKIGGDGVNYGEYGDNINYKKSVRQDAYSQDGVKFGVRAEVGSYSFSFGYQKEDEEFKTGGFGGGVGLRMKVPFTNSLDLSTGLDLYIRGLSKHMSEYAVSIPAHIQITIDDIFLATGIQLDIPFWTKWNSPVDTHDYFTKHRASVDFGLAFVLGFMVSPEWLADIRCVIGVSGLFEDFEDSSVSYKDRSSLMQFGFGAFYLF